MVRKYTKEFKYPLPSFGESHFKYNINLKVSVLR